MEKTEIRARRGFFSTHLPGLAARATRTALRNIRAAFRDRGVGGEMFMIGISLASALFLLLPFGLGEHAHIFAGMALLLPRPAWIAWLSLSSGVVLAGIMADKVLARRAGCFFLGLVWSLVAVAAMYEQLASLTSAILPLIALFSLWLVVRWHLSA